MIPRRTLTITSKGMPKKKRKREETVLPRAVWRQPQSKRHLPSSAQDQRPSSILQKSWLFSSVLDRFALFASTLLLLGFSKSSLQHKLTENEYHLHRNMPQTKNPKRSRWKQTGAERYVAKTKPLRQNETWQTRRRRRRWAPNPRIDISRWSCLSDCEEAEDWFSACHGALRRSFVPVFFAIDCSSLLSSFYGRGILDCGRYTSSWFQTSSASSHLVSRTCRLKLTAQNL